MKQIVIFNVRKLRNEESFGFLQQVALLAQQLLTTDADKSVVEKLLAGVEKYDVALNQRVKNSQTEAVGEADRQFDAGYIGIAAQCRALTLHPDPDVRAIGKEALAVWEKYGNITKRSYNEEYGAAYNYLQDMYALGSEKLTRSGLGVWVDSLQGIYDRFIASREAQVSEESVKVTGIVKNSRKDCEGIYRDFINQVNAHILVYGEESYSEFVDRMNVIIASAKATLKARSTRAENSKEEQEETDEGSTTEE